MRKSVKLALRASEIRSEANKLEPNEANAEKRAQLMAELEAVETEFRQALTAEEETANAAPAADGLSQEEREFRALRSRASVGAVYASVIEHRQTEGAERELQAHLGLAANQIPLDLLMETRAVTPAPADVGQNQAAIIQGVFPYACGAWMGVDMPRVGVGEAVYPVLTQNALVGAPAENALPAGGNIDADGSTTGSFTADVLSPGRLQAAFFHSREDRARFLGMDMALRDNLRMALADALDAQIISGTNGLLTGANLAAHAAGAAVTTYAQYRERIAYGRVDGSYAGTTKDLKIVMGSASYAHAATQFRSANAGDRAALEDLMDVTGGVKVSAHVPAVANNLQNCVIRLGMRRDMVAPIWEGVTLIPDEITKAGTGQIVVTAVMLFAVKILRAAGFHKQQLRHAV